MQQRAHILKLCSKDLKIDMKPCGHCNLATCVSDHCKLLSYHSCLSLSGIGSFKSILTPWPWTVIVITGKDGLCHQKLWNGNKASIFADVSLSSRLASKSSCASHLLSTRHCYAICVPKSLNIYLKQGYMAKKRDRFQLQRSISVWNQLAQLNLELSPLIFSRQWDGGSQIMEYLKYFR